jgi:SET domain-containing protein
MFDIFIDKRMYIARSPMKGAEWGVFSDSFIPKGTTIEIARSLKLKNKHLFQDDNILNDYVFKLDDKHSLIALGFGSLFNHSDNPNVTYRVTDGKVFYTTTTEIYPDKEIFVSYGDTWWKSRDIKHEKSK